MKTTINLKQFGLLSLALLIFISLTACGDDNNASSDSDGITLELWHTWTEDRPENNIYKDQVEKFNEEHSDITIELKGIPVDDLETKLRTQAAAGEFPDMVKGYPGERMKSFVDADQVIPIEDIMDTWEDKIPEELLGDLNFNGEQYAIPTNISVTSLVYYNKDMLNQVGYDEFPTEYDDFKKLIEELNGDDITPIALGNKAPWVLQSCYISSIGDRFTGSDFLNDALNGDAKFTDERFVNALSIIDELSDMQAFNENFNTIDEERSRNSFIDEESAMHIAGSWALGPIIDNVTDTKKIGVAPFPSVENGDGDPNKASGTFGGAIYLANDMSDEKKEAGKTFLKFFYDDTMYNKLVKEANIPVPVEVDVEGLDDLTIEVNKITENGLAPVYDANLTPELTDEINKGLQSITTDSITPEKLSEDMQKINEKD